jgi:hypothetical protein
VLSVGYPLDTWPHPRSCTEGTVASPTRWNTPVLDCSPGCFISVTVALISYDLTSQYKDVVKCWCGSCSCKNCLFFVFDTFYFILKTPCILSQSLFKKHQLDALFYLKKLYSSLKHKKTRHAADSHTTRYSTHHKNIPHGIRWYSITHPYNNIYENTSLSVQHRYKVTVHINNSEGDKNCAYKVNQWIDVCKYMQF